MGAKCSVEGSSDGECPAVKAASALPSAFLVTWEKTDSCSGSNLSSSENRF